MSKNIYKVMVYYEENIRLENTKINLVDQNYIRKDSEVNDNG